MSTSEDLMEHCVNAVTEYYIQHRKLPGTGDILKTHPSLYKDEGTVAAIFSDKEFERRICFRGVPWKRFEGVTTKMMLAMQVVMNPADKRSLSARLKAAGISWSEWRIWQKNPRFRSMVETYARDTVEEAVPLMQRALVQRAEEGDLKAIEYAFKFTGTFDPNASNAMEVRAVIAAMIEIVSKHVQDPEVLNKIGFELGGLATKALPSGGSQNGHTYIPAEVIEARTD